jgi:hypothetical protein
MLVLHSPGMVAQTRVKRDMELPAWSKTGTPAPRHQRAATHLAHGMFEKHATAPRA